MKRVKAENFIGQTFGNLTVISVYKKNNRSYCHCQCSCGRTTEVVFSNLRTGNTTSCGDKTKHSPNYFFKDLTGQKFGLLTVLTKTNKRSSNGKILWHCKCECGNECDIRSDYLINHHTESCGCKKASKGEAKIAQLLINAKIPFIQQKTFNTCRFDTGYLARFDFYVNNKYLIEYDGEQHFNYSTSSGWNNENNLIKNKKYDKIKNEWCKNNNIPLIRIPYTKFSTLTIEDLLLDTSQFVLKGDL